MTADKKRIATMCKAIQWSHRLDTEEDIETNWTEFMLWLEQSPQHRDAYHRAQVSRCDSEIYRETVVAEGIDEEALVSELSQALVFVFTKLLWGSLSAILILGAGAMIVRAYTGEGLWTGDRTTQVKVLDKIAPNPGGRIVVVWAGQVALIGADGIEVHSLQRDSDSSIATQ